MTQSRSPRDAIERQGPTKLNAMESITLPTPKWVWRLHWRALAEEAAMLEGTSQISWNRKQKTPASATFAVT